MIRCAICGGYIWNPEKNMVSYRQPIGGAQLWAHKDCCHPINPPGIQLL